MLYGQNAKASRNMAFSRARSTDQDDIFGRVHEFAAMQLADQGFIDLVRHQLPASQDIGDLLAHLGAGCLGLAQHVAGA